MSAASEVANTAIQLDWKLLAAAAATFLATFIISILGWYQGRKKVSEKVGQLAEGGTVTGAILLDNQTIREATVVSRELRDRLIIHGEVLHSCCKATVDNTNSLDEILAELKGLRRSVDKLPTRP